MKKYLGCFLFVLSLECSANSSAVLLLRAVVPTQMKVSVTMEKTGPRGIIHSNMKHGHTLPKFVYKKKTSHYLVSIIHP